MIIGGGGDRPINANLSIFQISGVEMENWQKMPTFADVNLSISGVEIDNLAKFLPMPICQFSKF